ncbi:MAG TPA: DNA-processing protein DprA [Anaerolineaceae bacterium]|nr:DNA-processing protein DprA [Anaerolineaceae bacterium]
MGGLDSRAYWVGFNMVKGIGAVRVRALISAFGNLEAAWGATPQQLLTAGLSVRIVENFLLMRKKVDLEATWEKIRQAQIEVVTWDDEDYPGRLKEIDQPPPLLYTRGGFQPEDEWAVAIVGTRRITPYGRQVAEDAGAFLARNKVTVVSGLARGVDATAHDAALKAGGRTIAVLGSGVDRIYPPENGRLAERIVAQGAVVSDYAPGTPPDAANFPPRNRIISGLSLATIVIEAGDESGALITATFAAEQGREVFAVPGNIFAPQSKGANRLIRDGARPLLKMEEILEALELTQVSEHQAARTLIPADDSEAEILKVLGAELVHIDEIRAQLDLPIEKVSATLTMMELKGMVRQTGGMNYMAVRESQGEYRIDEDHG